MIFIETASKAHANHGTCMVELETINVSPGAGAVGRCQADPRWAEISPSINDSNRYQQPPSTVTSLIR